MIPGLVIGLIILTAKAKETNGVDMGAVTGHEEYGCFLTKKQGGGNCCRPVYLAGSTICRMKLGNLLFPPELVLVF